MYVCLVGTSRSIRNNHLLKLCVDSFLQIWVPTPERKVLTAVCTGGQRPCNKVQSRCFSKWLYLKVLQQGASHPHIGTVVSHLKLTPVSHPRFTGTHYSLQSIEFTTFNIKYLCIPCIVFFLLTKHLKNN